VKDPFAGTTASSIYMQVVPSITGFNFSGVTVDSMILVLPYAGFTWGDTTTKSKHNVSVYTINQSFSKDSTYFNFNRLSTDATPVGTAVLFTGPTTTGVIQDPTKVHGVDRASHLRVRMSASFVTKFTDALKSDTTFAGFTTALPGVMISVDTTGAGQTIPYFRLNQGSDIYTQAGIVAYAHTNGATDTLTYLFPYDEKNAAHFNRITRNYFNPHSNAADLLQSTATNDSRVMMQNGPGTAIDLQLPYIQKLSNDPIVIVKAELVFTEYDTASAEEYFGPARLYPQGMNPDGTRYSIADRYPITDATLDFMGGTPNKVVRNGVTVTEYRLNIPRELQNTIVQGKTGGLHLRIGGTANYPGAYRLVLGGRGNTDPLHRLSLNIIYSKQ
jgi:hypothetical protein